MMNLLKPLCSPRIRISVLMTVSVLAMLLCFVNLPIIYVGLIELSALAGCVVFFRNVDVSQFEMFQYKPHWFLRICEWIWGVWFVVNSCNYAIISYPSLIGIFHFNYPCNKFFSKVFHENLLFFESHIIFIVIGMALLPLYIIIFRYLINIITTIIEPFSSFEKYYFIFFSVFFIVTLIIAGLKTSFFVCPVEASSYVTENNNSIVYSYNHCDHFLNTDTTSFLIYKFYRYTGACFRHPFFATAMIPFYPLFDLISFILCFFIKSKAYSYALSIAITQILLYVFSGICVGRLFSTIVDSSFSPCIYITYICSFPFVFTFAPERLIFTSFYLIFAVYLIICKKRSIIALLISILSIGTTTLSFVPLAATYFLNRKILQLLTLVITMVVIFLVFNYKSNFDCVNENLMMNKCCNYCQMLESAFFVPEWEQYYYTHEDTDSNNITKQMSSPKIQSTLKCSCHWTIISGSLIFILCCSGFTLFYNERIVQTSFIWLLTSLGIIGIIGFGNKECVMFNTYFSWAIIPLALLPFYWLWQKYPRLPIPQALYLFAAYLAISNLYFLYQVVQIVGEHYIVPPGM